MSPVVQLANASLYSGWSFWHIYLSSWFGVIHKFHQSTFNLVMQIVYTGTKWLHCRRESGGSSMIYHADFFQSLSGPSYSAKIFHNFCRNWDNLCTSFSKICKVDTWMNKQQESKRRAKVVWSLYPGQAVNCFF